MTEINNLKMFFYIMVKGKTYSPSTTSGLWYISTLYS